VLICALSDLTISISKFASNCQSALEWDPSYCLIENVTRRECLQSDLTRGPLAGSDEAAKPRDLVQEALQRDPAGGVEFMVGRPANVQVLSLIRPRFDERVSFQN
jgi:hypothetical protein